MIYFLVKANSILYTTLTIIKRLVQVILCATLALVIAFIGLFVYILLPLDAPVGGFYFNKTTTNFTEMYEAGLSGITFQMNEDGETDLNILVMTDFHIMGLPLGVDSRTRRIITRLIEQENPDLILILGDNLSSPFNHKAQRRFINIMDSFNIPWAPILGNHDAQGKATEAYLISLLERRANHPDSNLLFRTGPNNIGVLGNYFINIQNADGQIIRTFIMTSSEESPWFNYDYAPYTLGQVDWYEWVVRGVQDKWGEYDINSGTRKPIPSSLMLHIPLPVFETAYTYGHISGENRIGVWSSTTDNGFFERIQELGSTTHIVAGHDHCNDWIAYYKGIYFASVPSATGNIGILGAPSSMTGAMRITLTQSGEITQTMVALR